MTWSEPLVSHTCKLAGKPLSTDCTPLVATILPQWSRRHCSLCQGKGRGQLPPGCPASSFPYCPSPTGLWWEGLETFSPFGANIFVDVFSASTCSSRLGESSTGDLCPLHSTLGACVVAVAIGVRSLEAGSKCALKG